MIDTDITSKNLERAQIIMLPTMSVLGVITNILSLVTLSRQSLRSFSCTQYFLILSIVQLLDSIMIPVNEVFVGALQFSNSLVTTLSCKLILFFGALFPFESSGLIVLASVDRFCASSLSANLRAVCKVSVAYRAIAVLTLISILYISGLLVIADVSYLQDNATCDVPENSAAQIYALSVMFCITIVVMFLTLLFGLLTIYNIRKQQRRVAPSTNPNRRTDTQLTIMLIVQISAIIIFTGPFCIVFLMSTFMSEEQAANASINLAGPIADIWQSVSNSATFFLYTLTASLYRKELMNVFRKCYNRLRRQ